MAAIDSIWLNRLIAQVQELSVDVVTSEQSEVPVLVRRFVADIAAPPDPLHKALLSNILLDVCRHVFESFHASLSVNKCTCAAEGWSGMTRFARWYEDDPKESLTSWVDAFLPVYLRNHPPTVGTRAAERLRREPAKGWTVAALARAFGVTPKALGREFRERFGIGIVEYLHAARVSLAIMVIEKPWKIEAIAYEVGYRSKKDFYRAFKRWTGLTPACVRNLPSESRRLLFASMRATCLWGNGHTIVQVSQGTCAGAESRREGEEQRRDQPIITRAAIVPARRMAG